MSSRCALFACSLSLITLLAPNATAVVMEWELGKVSLYSQTTADTPPTFPYRYVYAEFATDTPLEYLSVTLGGSPLGDRPLDAQPGGTQWDGIFAPPPPTTFSGAFPDGVYVLTAANFLETAVELVDLRRGDLASVPYFTGSLYDILASVNPAAAIPLQWNTPGTEVTRTTIRIEPLAGGPAVLAEDATGQTSLSVPAGTLAPNTTYILSAEFASEVDDPRGGFATGVGSSVLASLTDITFTTGDVPEPAGVCLLAGLTTLVARRRRR
ncbi:hypothetical protein Pla123a_01720 [Posidoniimonas polymericola]|uniref:PEP-CTERM protein-sorting domain-containing protein n=1 Tax=Posidoniimonas polymericola TaxID=2528002 RepID=A0A5C5ZDX2_9BACT|nr:hypothetical protein [Posidoniimonas polymericola]TWT85365.1 hypothetical protein Pla123a_01720 [Posidoniimonas polymericola]